MTYFANNPIYMSGGGGNNFNLMSPVPTNFHSLVGGISFVGGSVNLTLPTSGLIVTTVNSPVSIPKIIGAGATAKHLLVSAGMGLVSIGDAPVSFIDVSVTGDPITLTGPLTGDSINIVSGPGGITNSVLLPWVLTANNTILIDAVGGTVGTALSPITVSIPGGIITVGATGSAHIDTVGATGDGFVHCLPNNPPAMLFINDVLTSCNSAPACDSCCPIAPACNSCCSISPPVPPIPPCPPKIIITNNLISFVSIYNFRAVGGAVYDAFGFSLASDFFFQRDKAESGHCTSSTDCSSGECITTTSCDCEYNIYTIEPTVNVKPWWLLSLLALPVAYLVYRRIRKIRSK